MARALLRFLCGENLSLGMAAPGRTPQDDKLGPQSTPQEPRKRMRLEPSSLFGSGYRCRKNNHLALIPSVNEILIPPNSLLLQGLAHTVSSAWMAVPDTPQGGLSQLPFPPHFSSWIPASGEPSLSSLATPKTAPGSPTTTHQMQFPLMVAGSPTALSMAMMFLYHSVQYQTTMQRAFGEQARKVL